MMWFSALPVDCSKVFTLLLHYTYCVCLFLCVHHPTCWRRHCVFSLSHSRVHLSACPVRYIVNMISHEQLLQFDKTDREYSLATTDDLFRFWRSKVKVTVGCRAQICEHYISWTTEQSRWNLQGITIRPCWWPGYILEVKGQGHRRLWWRHPRWCWRVKVHLLACVMLGIC